MQISICLLAVLVPLANSQHFIWTDFDHSGGQFRQQFFDPYGNAHGVYSYVNPSGQIVRVQYSTGALPATQRTFPFLQQFSIPSVSAPVARYFTSPTNEFVSTERNETAPLTNLFTPAVVQYPVATAGQLENYRKALEQYAKEVQE